MSRHENLSGSSQERRHTTGETPTLQDLIITELTEQQRDGRILFCLGGILPELGPLQLPELHLLVSPRERIDHPLSLDSFAANFFATIEPDRHYPAYDYNGTVYVPTGRHSQQIVTFTTFSETAPDVFHKGRFQRMLQGKGKEIAKATQSHITPLPVTETTIIHILPGPELITLAGRYLEFRRRGIEKNFIFDNLTRGIVPAGWYTARGGTEEAAEIELQRLIKKDAYR